VVFRSVAASIVVGAGVLVWSGASGDCSAFARSTITSTPPGSLTNPFRLRTTVALPNVKGWSLRVNRVIANANNAVISFDPRTVGINHMNVPPGRGYQYFMINVTTKYHGPTAPNSLLDVAITAVAMLPNGKFVYYLGGDEHKCGWALPNQWPLPFNAFLKPRRSNQRSWTGNICWKIRTAHVRSMILDVHPEFPATSKDNVSVFFSTR
jgi:hypothetical protein